MLSSTPDLYLDELRLELQERLGVTVSSTILRTLIKGGYSMKKVCHLRLQSNNVLLTVQSACIHRQECCRLPYYLLWTGLGNTGEEGNQEGLLLPWKKVSMYNITAQYHPN